ncbi:MAG TPA: hypothetical protein ENK91_09690 [Bacteroidetes bacterium]|nr:hypothetical protein [Bacteroidota bacterium]
MRDRYPTYKKWRTVTKYGKQQASTEDVEIQPLAKLIGLSYWIYSICILLNWTKDKDFETSINLKKQIIQ